MATATTSRRESRPTCSAPTTAASRRCARATGAALDAALADELTYVHSTARLESKAEHIAQSPGRQAALPRHRAARRTVRVHGGVGIVNGVSEMHVERDGKEQRFTVRYLAVYAKAGERVAHDRLAVDAPGLMPSCRVLVIGATGFIGPRLIRKLVARGETVVGMDLNPGAATFAGVPIGAPVLRGDITQFEDVMRTVLDVKPERVINLAYGLGAGEGNPHQVMRLDILGMDNCFEAARLAGVKRRGLRELDRGERPAEPLRRPAWRPRTTRRTAPASTRCTRSSTSSRPRSTSRTTACRSSGVRPANVTGPDKVRGSVDHVQIMVDAARGRPVHLPNKGLMRHLDPRGGHRRGLRPRAAGRGAPPFALQLGRDPGRASASWRTSCAGSCPDAQITFANEGGREESGNYLVDWSRLAKEFGIEYPGLHTRVLEIINEVRRTGRAPAGRRADERGSRGGASPNGRRERWRYNRISADCHLDMIWLPPDLFVSEAPRELKDRMPYVADGAGRAAMGRQQRGRRSAWPAASARRARSTCRASSCASTRWPHRPLRGRQEGHPPAGRSAPARQGDGPRRRRRRGHLRHPGRGGQAERQRGVQRDAAHLQHVAERLLQPLSRPAHRPRVPAVRRHRRRGGRGPSGGQARLQGPRALVLVGHGAHVAPDAGSRCGRRSTRSGIPLHFHTFPSVSPKLREQYTGLTQRALCLQRASACSR